MKGMMIMKNMKRYLSLLLTLVLILTQLSLPAFAEGGLGGEAQQGTNANVYPDELIVGHPTITKGDFFTEMFGNDTADIDVRALIHGYNLVNWDQNQGVYIFDKTVVQDILVVDDEVGNRTYYLELLKSLFLAGNNWPLLGKNCVILAGYAVLLLGLAFLVTRKKVE